MSVSTLLAAIHWLCTVLLTVVVLSLALRPVKRDARIGKLEADYDDLHTRVQRLAGRMGRQKQVEEAERELPIATEDTAQSPGETDIAWKRRLRTQLAAGKLSHK